MKKIIAFAMIAVFTLSYMTTFAEEIDEPEFDLIVNNGEVENEAITEPEFIEGTLTTEETSTDIDEKGTEVIEEETESSAEELPEESTEASSESESTEPSSEELSTEPSTEATDSSSEPVDEHTEGADEETTEEVTEPVTEDVIENPSEEPQTQPQEEMSSENEENYGIDLLSIYQEEPPSLNYVGVSTSGSMAEILIEGDNLFGVNAAIKITSVGDNKIVYMRQIKIYSYGGCVVDADLSGYKSQLFTLSVACGKAGRYEQLFVCGEAEKLTCTHKLTGISVSAKADIGKAQTIGVKITEMNGEIVFARQMETATDGSYNFTAEFPTVKNNSEYMVFVTENLTGRQFVKKVGVMLPDDFVMTKTAAIQTEAGGMGEVIIYGKNLNDTSRYIYEIEYNASDLKVNYMNLVGDEVTVISVSKGRIVFESKNRNMSGKKWSGTINAVQFTSLTGKSSEVRLSVYAQ